MDDKLLLEILKIIKQSKIPILEAFDKKMFDEIFVDYDVVSDKLQTYVLDLAKAIRKNAGTFNRNYSSQKDMIEAVQNSFSDINYYIDKLVEFYCKVKSNLEKDDIQSLISLKFFEKVLYDYLLWCEKLENAFLGMGTNEIIFTPDIKIENEIVNYLATHTSNNSCMIPFFGGLGLGFLLDD